MTEVKIGNEDYLTGRLTPMQQLHVARKMGPLLAGSQKLLDVLTTIPLDELVQNDEISKDTLQATLSSFAPFAEVFAEMSDETVEYVINTCMTVVRRKSNGGWAPIVVNGHFMFQEINMPVMMRLTWEVVRENLFDFFQNRQ